MKTVEMVELVLENGESYQFDSMSCNVEMERITNNKVVIGGQAFNHKIVGKLELLIHNSEDKNGLFDNIKLSQNILQVILHGENKFEVYYVNWKDGDVDENSYQEASTNEFGDLKIVVSENDKT